MTHSITLGLALYAICYLIYLRRCIQRNKETSPYAAILIGVICGVVTTIIVEKLKNI